jgi:tetratricopeptide (TPR) repeat protein
MRHLGCAFAFAAVLVSSTGTARAADNDEPIGSEAAQQVANDVDSELAKMKRDLEAVGQGYNASTPAAEIGRVERRLREGEIHYLLNDYLRAAIVLLDVVEDESAKSHPRYDECVYLLADSLRKSKNYSGARRYFEEILPRATGDRLKDVVLALLDIASATDHYEDVERYASRLSSAGGLARPDVDYIYGKMLFKSAGTDTQKIQRAYEVFRSIGVGNAVSGQAAYYAGVALVKLGRYEDAIRQFGEALSRVPKGPDGQQLKELTNLSLGRLYQELGDESKSADAYQEIPQSSPYFGDTLYEVAWTHVKAANTATDPEQKRLAFVRALRATELLMATSPDSRLYPQARILEGNLQIRLGASESAYDTFQTLIDRYGVAKAKLDDILQQSPDPKQFFDQLIVQDLGNVAGTQILPPVAINWAKDEADMSKAVAMHQDLEQSKKFMDESKELVATLSQALDGEGRFGMVPGLRTARTKALSIENRLVNMNRRLLNLERRMIASKLSPAEKGEIDTIHARVMALEAEIQALPQTEEAVESEGVKIQNQYKEAGIRAYRQAYRVSTMRAQIAAVEHWINENRDKIAPESLKLFVDRVAGVSGEIRELESALGQLQSEIRTGGEISGKDAGRIRARKLRSDYGGLVAQEISLLKSKRDRIPNDMQGLTSRIDGQRTTMQQIDSDLQVLDSKVEQQIQRPVMEAKALLAAEAEKLSRYEGEYGDLRTKTGDVLGPVATRTLHAVDKQFGQFVLEADVGIIDVAWARKQAETKKVNDLIKEQQDRTLELENEFSDVLEEQ